MSSNFCVKEHFYDSLKNNVLVLTSLLVLVKYESEVSIWLLYSYSFILIARWWCLLWDCSPKLINLIGRSSCQLVSSHSLSMVGTHSSLYIGRREIRECIPWMCRIRSLRQSHTPESLNGSWGCNISNTLVQSGLWFVQVASQPFEHGFHTSFGCLQHFARGMHGACALSNGRT